MAVFILIQKNKKRTNSQCCVYGAICMSAVLYTRILVYMYTSRGTSGLNNTTQLYWPPTRYFCKLSFFYPRVEM